MSNFDLKQAYALHAIEVRRRRKADAAGLAARVQAAQPPAPAPKPKRKRAKAKAAQPASTLRINLPADLQKKVDAAAAQRKRPQTRRIRVPLRSTDQQTF